MRSALPMLLLLVGVVACGDDDVGSTSDSGFTIRDAAMNPGCHPYYLSSADRAARGVCNDTDAGNDAGDDAGAVDAGPLDAGDHDGGTRDAGLEAIVCEASGTLNSACDSIAWCFAGGEQIALAGCCTPSGQCGGMDPTGLGCIARDVFGLEPTTCSYLPVMDAGDDDASDRDASAI